MCSVPFASGYRGILATPKIMQLGWSLILMYLKAMDFFSSSSLATLVTPWARTHYLFIPVSLKSKRSNNLQSFSKGDTSGTGNRSSVWYEAGNVVYNTGHKCAICKMSALDKSASAECYCSSPFYQQWMHCLFTKEANKIPLKAQ